MANTYAVQSEGCRFESLWGFGFYLKGAHYEVDYSGKKTYLAGLQCTLTSSCAKRKVFAPTTDVRSSILTLPSSIEILSLLVILSNVDFDFFFFEGLSIDNDLSMFSCLLAWFQFLIQSLVSFFQAHVGG